MNFLKPLIFVSILLPLALAKADEVRTIQLHPAESDPISVGTLTLLDQGGYRIDWDDTKFGDFFLSMRPFKCLEGPQKLWCRVDYPYENKRVLTTQDVTDLEYDLLFVWKNANDYGINMWNGVYYELEPTEAGFEGVLYEFDMDTLAAPPEDGSLRPIAEDILDEGDPDSHWLPRITIN